MLQKKRACTGPQGDGHARWGEKEIRRLVSRRTDQYSLGSSSVVTLRSHSVMIQSVRIGDSS